MTNIIVSVNASTVRGRPMYNSRVNDVSSLTIGIVGSKDAMTASIKC